MTEWGWCGRGVSVRSPILRRWGDGSTQLDLGGLGTDSVWDLTQVKVISSGTMGERKRS